MCSEILFCLTLCHRRRTGPKTCTRNNNLRPFFQILFNGVLVWPVTNYPCFPLSQSAVIRSYGLSLLKSWVLHYIIYIVVYTCSTWWCKKVKLPNIIPFFLRFIGSFNEIDIGPKNENRCLCVVLGRFIATFYFQEDDWYILRSQFHFSLSAGHTYVFKKSEQFATV